MGLETATLTRREADILRAIHSYEKPLDEELIHATLYNIQEIMMQQGRWKEAVFNFVKKEENWRSTRLQLILNSLVAKGYMAREENLYTVLACAYTETSAA